jgi:transcriptional regulator with XRE-family HTH domain
MNPKTKNLTGQKIRLYRKQRGWTQNMLAASLQKMGVPISAFRSSPSSFTLHPFFHLA